MRAIDWPHNPRSGDGRSAGARRVDFKRLPEKYKIQQLLGNNRPNCLEIAGTESVLGLGLFSREIEELFIRTAERFLFGLFLVSVHFGLFFVSAPRRKWSRLTHAAQCV